MEMKLNVKRGYVETSFGQIHFRYAGDKSNPAISIFHPSPGSARQLHFLIEALSKNFFVYAPDTPGNGLSDPLNKEVPEIEDYAHVHYLALKKLKINKTHLFGSHTGASIAASIVKIDPKIVDRLFLDSVGLYSSSERSALLKNYAPTVKTKITGEHLLWTWNFIRDQWLFWPWYEHKAKNRLNRGLPELSYLNDMCVDVLQSLQTYHLSYRAAFRFNKEACFKSIKCPTTISSSKDDMLFKYFPKLQKIIPNSASMIHEGWQDKKSALKTAKLIFSEI